MIAARKIEFFFGTGGVGKTTLATSRAIHLAHQGKKVLIITIDPSLRLKQILNIEKDEVEPSTVFSQNIHQSFSTFTFDAKCLNPAQTLFRTIEEAESHKDNQILQSLSSPYGGLNEIMAVIELQHYLDQDQYDCIIIDTPPGRHFVDFLKATEKINAFFDKSFVEIFKYLGKKLTKDEIGPETSPGLLNKLFSSGLKKLLGYLESVTGSNFVNLFIDTILVLYQNRRSFLRSLEFQKMTKNSEESNLFLVTAVDHNKVLETIEINESVSSLTANNQYLLINRSLQQSLKEWNVQESLELNNIKESMLEKEEGIIKYAKETYENHYLSFPYFIDNDLSSHLYQLSQRWSLNDH